MKVENENLKSIYDLFALCCSRVMEDCNQGKFEIPNCDEDDEEYKNIEGLICAYVEDRKQEGKREALETLLGDLVKTVGYDCTSVQAFKIAKAIDKKAPTEEPVSEDAFSQFVSYSALNRYLEDEFRIFPVLESSFVSRTNSLLTKSGAKYPAFRNSKPAYTDIGTYFKHYIVMNRSHIAQYPLKVVRAKAGKTVSKIFSDKNTLKIDLIPFTQVSIEEIGDIKCEGDYFWLQEIKRAQEERLLKKLEKYFADQERDKADFVIFPEMLFTEKMLDCCKENASFDEIVVNGSIWKDGRNKCIVSRGTEEVIRHYKRCPFNYKKVQIVNNKKIIKEYQEKLLLPLDMERNKYQILEIEGFGRVCVGICRDLDYGEMQRLWGMMQINLLLIPSYTESGDMESSARALASLYNMIIVLCNACAAVEPVKEEEPGDKKAEVPIGFIVLPGKKGSTREPVVDYYYRNDKCAGCVELCRGYRLVIDLNKIQHVSSQGIKTYAWRWEG